MIYIIAASSLYHIMEQLSNPGKGTNVAQNTGYSLSPNTTSPQKNLASLLCRAPLAEKCQEVVARHHHVFYQQPTHKQLQSLHCRKIGRNPKDIDKYMRNCILSENWCTRYQERPDQNGYSCHSYYEVSHFKEEEKNKYQALQQDVQLELKSLRIVFEHQDNLPAILSKLR